MLALFMKHSEARRSSSHSSGGGGSPFSSGRSRTYRSGSDPNDPRNRNRVAYQISSNNDDSDSDSHKKKHHKHHKFF
jgi:hypothetical protein